MKMGHFSQGQLPFQRRLKAIDCHYLMSHGPRDNESEGRDFVRILFSQLAKKSFHRRIS